MEGCRGRGDDPDPNRANYDETGIGTTSAVGCFPGGKSPYEVEEMSGNVWEWTSTIYRDYPYVADDGREDMSDTDARRVLRGGSWFNSQDYTRAVYRNYFLPSSRFNSYGFRVVCTP